MTSRTGKVLATTAVLMVVAAGCSSSKSGGGGGGSSSSTNNAAGSGAPLETIKIGLIADITGAAASGNKTMVEGVKAGAVYAARQGYKINYVIGDTQTNPSNTLSVAQKLVNQDRVSAVIAVSALTFGGSPYLTAKNIPVIGAAQDGPEWQTAKNMFGVTGPIDQTKVTTTFSSFMKLVGV